MATRSSSTARNEILDLLKADHRKVKQAFRTFEGIDMEEDPQGVQQLVLDTCNALEVHATLEEELFYPAVREAVKDTMVVAEAEVEHAGAKMLIAQLRELDPSDEAFAASFTVLGEYVKHHIREEEKDMFEQLERARIDWEAVRDSMLERREALMASLGAGADGASGEEEDGSEQAAGKGTASEVSAQGPQASGRGGAATKRQASKSARAR